MPPVVAERAPLVIRTLADIRALSASPRVVKRLPPEGLIIDIPGLDQRERDAFRLQIKKYVHACGCSAGGATFLLASALCVVYAGYLSLDQAWVGFARTVGASMIVVPTLTIAAKFLALRLARLRFRAKLCRPDPVIVRHLGHP
jgi:hypothetical protein